MGTRYGGYMGRVLEINLSTREIGEYPWTDRDRELHLGGKIMAAKIMYDNIPGPVDPFSEENLLVFTTGPLTGSGAPSSSRFNVSTVSPLTGYLASSNCGGDFGLHLKKAGYDGLVISGRAQRPVWLEITDQKVIFHEAGGLWGRLTGETQELLGGSGGKVVIGPAGENLVLYAGIFSRERAAGRGGAGAVMGSKGLKAIVAGGKKSVQSKDDQKTRELNKNWARFLLAHPITGKILPDLGTANLVRRMQRRGMLATRNFKYGQYPDYDRVSGEYMKEHYLVKNTGCLSCPIRCSRVVEVGGREVKGPELETLVLLGPNLENNDLPLICRWNHLLDQLGMDAMSTGGTLAFAMELQEKGLWDCGLHFGKTDNLHLVMEDIAYRRGIGDLLANGTKKLAERFGGKEFAANVKGLELAAYDPRGGAGQGLGYAVANRGGCHINSGYMVFMEGLGLAMDGGTTRAKASLAVLMQNLLEAISAAGSCIFTSYALVPGPLLDDNKSFLSHSANTLLKWSGPVADFLSKNGSRRAPFHLGLLPHTRALSTLTGMKITFGSFLETGARGYNLERLFNLRMGLTEKEDTLPARFTGENPDPESKRAGVPLPGLKRDYYQKRGWDRNGIPLSETLRGLGLLNG